MLSGHPRSLKHCSLHRPFLHRLYVYVAAPADFDADNHTRWRLSSFEAQVKHRIVRFEVGSIISEHRQACATGSRQSTRQFARGQRGQGVR